MNNHYQQQRERAGRSTGITNSLMTLLLVLGLGQMAICFQSAMKIVPEPRTVSTSILSQTNSTTAHGVTPASHPKI